MSRDAPHQGPTRVVIHGHFYQPPRENPWLDEVEAEPSAAPLHDWNERIERECYRAVVAARIPGDDGRIARVVNALQFISFDVGPTLLEWLERHAARTYAAILEADRLSRARHAGFGNAIAMPYHHTIMPLASRRDKVTEVRWGIADFRRRFRREPVGMWLPETAVDAETLDVLAAEGIAFTILAPHQVVRTPARGLPGRYRTISGRELAIFVYDSTLSHGVAFGRLIRDANLWLAELRQRARSSPEPRLILMATDGETYGHHHKFGEMALAAVCSALDGDTAFGLENLASFLARHPPEEDVELVAPSSWSCPHGVERWRADCGCKADPTAVSDQRWRAPLREALDWLASRLHQAFEREGGERFRDPWAARDRWGEVRADPSGGARFLEDHQRTQLDPAQRVRAWELLEMERDALRMFTSCGWFFDHLDGLEPVQVLRYAAHGIELLGSEAAALHEAFADRLAGARTRPGSGPTGRELYSQQARPRLAWDLLVAAGAAAMRAAAPDATVTVAGYGVRIDGDAITVTARTGKETTYRVMVAKNRGADPCVTVQPPAGDAVSIGLVQLPEPYRDAVRRSLREALAARHLGDAALRSVATGTAEYAQAVGAALLESVRALAQDRSADAVTRVEALLDLLELGDLVVPFDAQTEFYEVRRALGADQQAALAPLAWRLGFVAET